MRTNAKCDTYKKCRVNPIKLQKEERKLWKLINKVKVTLKGFEKEIKRTFIINDNMKINDFCKAIITSMNGDLEHLQTLKYKDKYYICDYMEKQSYNDIKMNNLRISKLMLGEKDKLELTYDFGDNWVFKISIAKIIDGHNNKKIELIDGIGKGIEEDCGGVWGLEDLINDKSNDWGYDYDDFDIKEINDELDKKYNI